MATPVKKPSQKFSVNRRPSGECDDGRKDHPTSGGFLSNDGFLWTDTNPDLKLIEPRILVSVNYNYLEFSRKAQRPPERRTISLINHGDHPVAFQVQTTDNYSYFVDRRHGIIPPRQCSVNAIVKMANASVIHVHRRPHQEYPAENRAEFYNVPHKDKMVILLAPQICQTFAPEAMFHYERCHEKLKIMLRYTGIEAKPGADNPKQQLLHIVPGWCTWQEGTGLGENIRNKNAARQLAKFKKQEATLNRTASREQCEEEEKKRPKLKKVATPTKKPAILPAPDAPPEAAKKKEGGGVIMKMLKNLNPFGKDDHPLPRSPKKIQTPEKADNTKKVPTDVLSGAKPADLEKNKNLEQPTPKVARKSMEANKKTNTEPTQHQMAGSKRGEIDKNKNIEQPTPVILRKTQEDKNKVDQATPKLVRKSLESKKATNEPLPSPQLPGSKRFEYDKNKNLEQGTPKVARKSMEKDVPTTDVGKKSKESRDKKAHSLEIAAPPDAKRKSSEDKKLESGSTLVKKSTEKPDKKDPPTPSHRKKLLDTAKTPDDRKEAPSARPKKSMEKGTPQTPIRRLKNRGDKSQEGDKEVNDTVPSSTKKSVRTNKTPPLEREKSKKD